MRVQIKLYGDMVKYAPGEENVFSLSFSSPVTANQVLDHLAIPEDKPYTVLLNGRRVDPSQAIQEGSTLVILPEISGG